LRAGELKGLRVYDGCGFGVDLLAGSEKGEDVGAVVAGGIDCATATLHGDADGFVVLQCEFVDLGAYVEGEVEDAEWCLLTD
jgi:hypothetical protein